MKLVAREFLFFFLALVVAIPVSMLFLYLMDLKPEATELSPEERVFQMEFLIIGAILGFLGVYLIRLTVWAVRKVIPQES